MKKTDDASQRFYDYLPERPRWGMEKDKQFFISNKKDIIEKANYIQVPRQKRGYIFLDLDYEAAIYGWEDSYLPEPTIIIENRQNGHAQYLYEIENPILFNLSNGNRNIKISSKAMTYYTAVQDGYRFKLGADFGFQAVSIKNPFSSFWNVYWRNNVYDLQYLSEFVDLPKKIYSRDNDEVYEGRHMEIFHKCRKVAYTFVNKFKTSEEFDSAVRSICLEYAQDNIWNNEQNSDFPESEVVSISKSISKWIWMHRNDGGFKQFSKNVGVMHLKENDEIKSNENEVYQSKNHQSLGSYYTNLIRSNKSLMIIIDTIYKLLENNRDVTCDNIARFGDVSYSTVYRNKNNIYNILKIIKNI